MVLSVAILLRWRAEHHRRPKLETAARAIDVAVDAALADPSTRTRDLGGAAGCREFGAAVVAGLN